tara:strand:- start:313 stop:792 length:480 start_codon:yes stop_codon:yes gene_type:complete
MRLLFVIFIVLNASSLFGQSKNNFTFYDEYNNKLLKVSQSFTSSKNHVQNIFNLKSEEKSRVLILDYVEAHDELLIKCNSASTLLSIYSIIPKREINKELLKTLESKITNNFTDISNNLEDLIDSFNFYIDNKFYNYKKIDILRSKMLVTLDEICSTID